MASNPPYTLYDSKNEIMEKLEHARANYLKFDSHVKTQTPLNGSIPTRDEVEMRKRYVEKLEKQLANYSSGKATQKNLSYLNALTHTPGAYYDRKTGITWWGGGRRSRTTRRMRMKKTKRTRRTRQTRRR